MIITTVAVICFGDGDVANEMIISYRLSIMVECDLAHEFVPPAVAPQHDGFPFLKHQLRGLEQQPV